MSDFNSEGFMMELLGQVRDMAVEMLIRDTSKKIVDELKKSIESIDFPEDFKKDYPNFDKMIYLETAKRLEKEAEKMDNGVNIVDA